MNRTSDLVAKKMAIRSQMEAAEHLLEAALMGRDSASVPGLRQHAHNLLDQFQDAQQNLIKEIHRQMP